MDSLINIVHTWKFQQAVNQPPYNFSICEVMQFELKN